MSAAATACRPPRAHSKANLSDRGTKALSRPPLLRCSIFECQFTPSNRTGLINLGVAENSLLTEWLIDYFQHSFKLEYSDFTYGTALPGSLRLFAALRKLMDTHFHAKKPVLPEHIIAGSGCGSVIDLLVAQIADPGDGILVSVPHYNGFVASFGCRNAVECVGVRVPLGEEALGGRTIEAYERALVESEACGVKIRAVMLCNPHNPLGFCYSREVLLEYCRFAEKHDIHLISDEIYALSVFATRSLPNATPFTSILSIDPLVEASCSPSRIHAIYGASKDWGANGLRLGALVSQSNPELHTAMESSCLLMKVSSVADALWSNLLLDPVALPSYLELNQRALSEAHEDAVQWLNGHGIPWRAGNAGHFIWIDFRHHLPTKSATTGAELELGFAQEEELVNRFAKEGVILARGAAYSHPIPGFFRLTFTVRRDYFELGLGRVERALGLRITRGLLVDAELRCQSVVEEKEMRVEMENGRRPVQVEEDEEGKESQNRRDRQRTTEAIEEVNEALAGRMADVSVAAVPA